MRRTLFSAFGCSCSNCITKGDKVLRLRVAFIAAQLLKPLFARHLHFELGYFQLKMLNALFQLFNIFEGSFGHFWHLFSSICLFAHCSREVFIHHVFRICVRLVICYVKAEQFSVFVCSKQSCFVDCPEQD